MRRKLQKMLKELHKQKHPQPKEGRTLHQLKKLKRWNPFLIRGKRMFFRTKCIRMLQKNSRVSKT
jgi:hypothetical protein